MFQKSLLNLFVLSGFLFFAGCTASKNTSQISAQNTSSIINGTPVLETDMLAKSTAGLLVNYRYDGIEKVWFQGCSASVLATRFILTAAHCVQGTTASDMAVNFTINSFTSNQQMNKETRVNDIFSTPKMVVRKVKNYIIHPGYSGSGDNDIALIILESDIPATAIPATFLPDQYLNVTDLTTAFDGQKVQVTLLGFGIINEAEQTETEVMRRTTLPARFDKRFVVTDQTGGTGGCFGDSGGPAYFEVEGKTFLVGVTHGPHEGSSTCHEEGEWLNPSLFQKFLKDSMADLESGKAQQN